VTPAHAVDDANRDFLRTALARKALVEDPELGHLNVGVKVFDRVAVLWGSVPSVELAERAVKVVAALPIFRRVESELEIEPFGPPGAIQAPGYLPDPASDQSRIPAKPKATSEVPIVGAIYLSPPVPIAESTQPSSAPAVATTEPVRRPFMGPPATLTGRLVAAEDAAVSTTPAVLQPELSGRPGPAATTSRLEDSLTALQAAEPRFQAVQVTVQGGVVTLRGPAHDPVTQQLAQRVAGLPGVQRVVVHETLAR
jgi:osmotically-inducible protein OsmY